MYKIQKSFVNGEFVITGYTKPIENMWIPIDEDNSEYQKVLQWLAEGNIPEENLDEQLQFKKNKLIAEVSKKKNDCKYIRYTDNDETVKNIKITDNMFAVLKDNGLFCEFVKKNNMPFLFTFINDETSEEIFTIETDYRLPSDMQGFDSYVYLANFIFRFSSLIKTNYTTENSVKIQIESCKTIEEINNLEKNINYSLFINGIDIKAPFIM